MPAPFRVLAISLLLASLSPTVVSATAITDDSNRWMDGVTLVVLDTDDIESLHAARAYVQYCGGTVGVMSPPSLLLGWIPDEAWPQLEGRMGIRGLHREPVTAMSIGLPASKVDAQTQTILNFYNAVVTGELRSTLDQAKVPDVSSQSKPGDVFVAPPIDRDAVLANLVARGRTEDEVARLGVLDVDKISGNQTMSGTVALSVFFAESDGTTDPNLYDWDYSHYQSHANLVVSGLMWWSFSADLLSGCWVAYLPTMYPPTDPRCETSLEIITRGSGSVSTLVSEIMGNFGYNSGDHFSRTTAFAIDQRIALGTDRTYVAFVGYNPPGTGSALGDGSAAWAYYYGPYTFQLWNTFNELSNRVFAHETGHIFGACDEYADGCACDGLCHNGVLNSNCEDCGDQVQCIMTANDDLTLCTYTDDHIGWRIPGECNQPALPAPTITGITPGSAVAGATVDLTVSGTNLVGLPRLDLGSDIVLNEVTLVDDTEMIANVTVGHLAAPGLRTAILQNPDLRTSSLVDAFDVIPTPLHYVSPAGGNVFPYTDPLDAANNLFDALAVAGPGDTVRLSTMTFNGINLSFFRDVELEGGWDATFTARDLQAKTEFILVQNIRAQGCALTLDGLILRDGSGRSEFLPLEGRYGGAVTVLDGSLTIVDCEIYENTSIVQNLSTGHGGAVYGHQSEVNVFDSVFTDNVAYQGGAIYYEGGSGTVSGNTFVTNTVSGAIGIPLGGAVLVNAASGVVFEDNDFDGNLGAQSGGAVYVTGSSGTEFHGGIVQSHTVTTDGAGVYATGSDLVVDGVRFENNVATSIGGGLWSNAPLTLRSCEFVGNSALVSGGLQATASTVTVEHSLFTGNSSTFAGAAAYLVGVGTGSFSGNTLDANLADGSAAVLLVDSSVTVVHNIVTNTTGSGLFCAGPALPTSSYNDVWNNSAADYDGCTPGPGSFSADPLFVDTASEDYHLGLHSPAVDTGDADPSFADPDGSRADLGRYGSHVFVMDQPAHPQNLTAQVDEGDAVLSWDANGEGDLASYVVYASDTSGFAPGLGTFVSLVAAGNTSVNLGPAGGTTYYRLAALDANGYMSGYSNEAELDTGTPVDPTPSHRWVLQQNVPNPFNPQTTIAYELRERGRVQLTVFDVTGRVVRRLVDGVENAGVHSVIWDATSDDGMRVASGMYFYKLRAGSFVATAKMVVLK